MKKALFVLGCMMSSVAFAQAPIEVTVVGPGGHSNGDYGNVNAVHAASNIIVKLNSLEPKLQAIDFAGGNSVNSIAGDASFKVVVPEGMKREAAMEIVKKAARHGVDMENKFRGIKAGQKNSDGVDISVRYQMK